MSFTDFITHNGKRVCKEHYIHLVQVSRIDGKISNEEMEMLHRTGKRFGLTDPEIDRIIYSETDHNYNPPYSLKGKFYHLYNTAQIMLADGIVQEREQKLIKRFAIEAGIEDSKIDDLISVLLEGIKENTDEEELFSKFRSNLLS